MIRRETALITAWRIDRYAGGLRNKAFFANVPPDMPEAQQKAWEALHKRRSREYAAAQQGEPLPPMSAAEQAEWDRNVALIGGEDQLRDLRVEKQFDPPLDQRQLLGAAAEFAHDYKGDWGVLDDGMTVGSDRPAARRHRIPDQRGRRSRGIQPDPPRRQRALPPVVQRSRPGGAGPGKLVALFDEQVHDSRAWFMNTSAIGPREPFTDYFRYRLVHFDNESNKRLGTGHRRAGGRRRGDAGQRRPQRQASRSADAARAVPAIAGASAAERQGRPAGDQRLRPADRDRLADGRRGGADNLRAFTREPGDKVEQIGQLPPPPPLAVAAVQSPALQQVLLAQQTVEALKARDLGSLAGLVAKAELTQAPAARPGLARRGEAGLAGHGYGAGATAGPGSAPGWLQRGKDLMESL